MCACVDGSHYCFPVRDSEVRSAFRAALLASTITGPESWYSQRFNQVPMSPVTLLYSTVLYKEFFIIQYSIMGSHSAPPLFSTCISGDIC